MVAGSCSELDMKLAFVRKNGNDHEFLHPQINNVSIITKTKDLTVKSFKSWYDNVIHTMTAVSDNGKAYY